MPLDVPSGAECFVDANIFYYALTEDPTFSPQCGAFLDRVGTGDVIAHATVHELADAVHKTMMTEIMHLTGQPRAGLIGWLNRNPDVIKRLQTVSQIARRLVGLNTRVLVVEPELLVDAVTIGADNLLLTNDALIVAVMRSRGLIHLVTNDDDFDRVPGLTVWKPR